jgi:hypothetical protein
MNHPRHAPHSLGIPTHRSPSQRGMINGRLQIDYWGIFRRPSGLPSIADILLHCREPPQRASSRPSPCSKRYGLFDNFVGAQQERLGDGEADRLSGLEVNHQLELGWELHRQVAYLGAA